MALQLSGTLHRPAVDQPLKNTRVLFRARVTSADTIMGATAEITTDENGAYNVSLYAGRYDIGAYINGHLHYLARDVLIDDESTASTLNELVLRDEYNDDITPPVIVEFRSLRAESVDAASRAESAADVADSRRQAVAADRVAVSQQRTLAEAAAEQTALDRQQTGEDRTAADEFASRAEAAMSAIEALPPEIVDTIAYALDLAGQAVAYASRDSASDKRINQILQTIGYAIDIAAQSARALPAAYLRALGATLHIDGQGRIGIGTNTPGAALDVAGGRLRLRSSQPPASSGAPGLPGEQAWDSNYEYRCVAANTWRRIPLQNW